MALVQTSEEPRLDTERGDHKNSADNGGRDSRYVVWLLLEEENDCGGETGGKEKKPPLLQPLIDKLAAQMQTPRFCGHVTVCGSTKNLEEIEVVGRVRDVVAKLTGSGGALRADEPVSPYLDQVEGIALQLTGPVSLPIAFTDVRSMQNTWQQDLFLAARPTVALNALAIALQSALLSGGPALIASQGGEVGHRRLLWAAPCEVPHYSLLYAEGGHDEEGNGTAKQKYERLRGQVREALGLVNSSGEYRCEGAALAVVQIGGPGIARGWEGIPSWRIVEKIPLKADDDEEILK